MLGVLCIDELCDETESIDDGNPIERVGEEGEDLGDTLKYMIASVL